MSDADQRREFAAHIRKSTAAGTGSGSVSAMGYSSSNIANVSNKNIGVNAVDKTDSNGNQQKQAPEDCADADDSTPTTHTYTTAKQPPGE